MVAALIIVGALVFIGAIVVRAILKQRAKKKRRQSQHLDSATSPEPVESKTAVPTDLFDDDDEDAKPILAESKSMTGKPDASELPCLDCKSFNAPKAEGLILDGYNEAKATDPNAVWVVEGMGGVACTAHTLKYNKIDTCLSITCFFNNSWRAGVHESQSTRVNIQGKGAIPGLNDLKKNHGKIQRVDVRGIIDNWYFPENLDIDYLMSRHEIAELSSSQAEQKVSKPSGKYEYTINSIKWRVIQSDTGGFKTWLAHQLEFKKDEEDKKDEIDKIFVEYFNSKDQGVMLQAEPKDKEIRSFGKKYLAIGTHTLPTPEIMDVVEGVQYVIESDQRVKDKGLSDYFKPYSKLKQDARNKPDQVFTLSYEEETYRIKIISVNFPEKKKGGATTVTLENLGKDED